VEGVVWACVLAILSVGPRFQCPALVCVCFRETSRTSSRWSMTLAMWPYSRELEVDVALFPLGARKPSVDRRVRGCRLCQWWR